MGFIISSVAWALKNVLSSNLEPIKEDIRAVKIEIKEINVFLKEHKADEFAHPQMLSTLEDKFANKEAVESRFKTIETRLDWMKHDGN